MNPWAALINGAILSVLPAAAVWLVLHLTPRRSLSAAARYPIWWITAAVTILMPLALILSDASGPPAAAPHWEWASAAPLASPGNATPTTVRVDPRSRPMLRIWQPILVRSGQWLRWISAFWALVSVLLLLRLGLSFASLSRKSARAFDAPEHLRGRLDAWLRTAGAVRRGSRLAGSREIEIPIAVGPWRPTILIPPRLFEQLDPADLEQIGLHEAIHLARRDDWALLVQRTLEAVFALHPVLRWVTRQIDLEREIACDDGVVAATGHPRTYAACLARMVELCGAVHTPLAAPNAAGSRSHFSRRIELLVQPARTIVIRPATNRVLLFAATLLFLAVCLSKAPALLAFSIPETPVTHTITAAPAPQSPPEEIPMKPRTVRKLAQSVAIAAALAVPPAAFPAEPPQGRSQQGSPVVQPDPNAPMLMLFCFDGDSMSQSELSRSIAAAKTFLAKRQQSGTLASHPVAVLQIEGAASMVKQDFTTHLDEINRALDGVAAGGSVTGGDGSQRLSALVDSFNKLAPLPGKKGMVLFTVGSARNGSDDQLRAAIDAAVRANIAIFPIDARGIK